MFTRTIKQDQTQPTFEMTPGFKPFTVIQNFAFFYITLTRASDSPPVEPHPYSPHDPAPFPPPLTEYTKGNEDVHGRIFKIRLLVGDTATTELEVTTKRSNEK